ncbi:HupE/UreJ family protein [Polaromonas jejuensis]|uniref:HupE/UreJ family protein n=1 Tax=Polaromonas jejuensis TaxID=457502 RepID=A0ABW0QFZ9_9BURK|nr:HupE/UreJ family protein [Polaromonas jejuensis]
MRLFGLPQTTCLSRLLFALVSALPLAAAAHTGVDGHAHPGFLMGFFHPLTGLDHLAAMVSVGLWSALAARRAGIELVWGPLGFASMLLVGASLGLQGVQIPAVEPMIAASLLVTGLLVATRWRVPGMAAALLVGVFALFHGLAHGYELADAADAWPPLAGMLTTTLLLHATGLGLGWALRRNSVWIPRAAGAGVAAFGVTLLAQLA